MISRSIKGLAKEPEQRYPVLFQIYGGPGMPSVRYGFPGMRVLLFAFGGDYAQTLRVWREKFLSEEQRVRSLGFDTRFIRIWEFYLAYCEAAFAAGNTDVVQFTLRRD